jgi:molecular chaperone Hsp33
MDSATIPVHSYFLRARNALFLRAEMEPVYVDYYLHLMQHEIHLEPAHDVRLKEALAAMVLHMASRPRDEATAWTAHYPSQTMNLFVTGDSRTGNVTGRVFTDHIREGTDNLLIAQVVRGTAAPRQSIVQVPGEAFLRDAEAFYAQSQQLPARFFRMRGHETFGMVAGMPDCDLEWLSNLTVSSLESVLHDEDHSLLEVRHTRFGCQCTLPKIVSAIAMLRDGDTEELFEDADVLEITCPRCGAKFNATREDVEGARDPDA